MDQMEVRKKLKFISYYDRVKEDPNFQAIELKMEEMTKKVDLQTLQMQKYVEFPYTLPPERDNEGPTEYKYYLMFTDETTYINRATQMSHRVKNEGKGVGYYNIGIEDDGEPRGIDKRDMLQSLATLFFMARQQSMTMRLVLMAKAKNPKTYWCQVRLEQKKTTMQQQNVRITLLGRDGAGKSTLLGVFLKGRADNGRGSARVNVFRNQHDFNLGRTTSISHHILGFDQNSIITNYDKFGQNTFESIAENSSKLLSFIDIGGNEKQAKTLLQGLSCCQPDYAQIVVAADPNTGIPEDHFDLAYALKIPMFLVLTKIETNLISQSELCSLNMKLIDWIQQKTLNQIQPQLIDNQDKLEGLVQKFQSNQVLPIFNVSCTNLVSLQLLKTFYSLLSPRVYTQPQKDILEMRVSEILKIHGQVILVGIVMRGTLQVYQKVLIGPFVKSYGKKEGKFYEGQISEIHSNRVSVSEVEAGQFCSIRIQSATPAVQELFKNKDNFRKGMAIISSTSRPRTSKMFIATLKSYNHSTKSIKHCSEPTVVTQTQIRQSARVYIDKCLPDPQTQLHLLKRFSNPTVGNLQEKIKEENKSNLDYFDQTLSVSQSIPVRVMFRFIHNPEYLEEGTQLVIKQEGMNLYGTIDQVIYLRKRANSWYSGQQSNNFELQSQKSNLSYLQAERVRSNSGFFFDRPSPSKPQENSFEDDTTCSKLLFLPKLLKKLSQ